ncbi:unnamed protein product [Paramecium pentaurelia]|uniref:Rho-GAP domain-containing protein n=1 Tax=Paramecium pentaurelia TaxID=43138 RepID=A0A8S1XRA3_9CILI|nr:unnamed protein product [Paramecium pentaurelia]
MDQSINDAEAFLKQKIKINPLKDQMQQNQKNYEIQLQVAHYFKKSESYTKKPAIKLVSNENDEVQVYFIYGEHIPDQSKKQDYESFKIDIIETMHPKIDRFFIIVFFNTNMMTASTLNDFKDFYGTLPEKYFFHMKKFIVLHANFIVKGGGIFGMNEIKSFFKKITTFADTLLILSKEEWFKYKMLAALPESVKAYDQSYRDIENQRKKTVFRKQQTQQAVGDDEIDSDDNFNKDSKILGLNLDEYERNKYGIPIILDMLVQYFEKQPEKLKTEGIFRKQAAVYEEKVVEAALACQKVGFVNKVENAHTIACVFKQFFLKLKEPIMTYQLYEWVVQNKPQIEQNLEVSVQMLFDYMPELNREILLFSLGFLNSVIQEQEHNLMTTYNMAVVFGPNFFRSEIVKMADLGHVTLFVQIVQIMLELKKDYDYKKMLEVRSDNLNFDASLVPFLPDDLANLDDILDMVSDKNVVNETERKELKSRYK